MTFKSKILVVRIALIAITTASWLTAAPLFYDCTGREEGCLALFPGNSPSDSLDDQIIHGRIIVDGLDLGRAFDFSDEGGYRLHLRRGNVIAGLYFGGEDGDASYAIWNLPNPTPVVAGRGYDPSIVDSNENGDLLGLSSSFPPFLYIGGGAYELTRELFEQCYSGPSGFSCGYLWDGSGYDYDFRSDGSYPGQPRLNRYGQVLVPIDRFRVDAEGNRVSGDLGLVLVSLNGGPEPVPEPSTFALIGTAALMLIAASRQRP